MFGCVGLFKVRLGVGFFCVFEVRLDWVALGCFRTGCVGLC